MFMIGNYKKSLEYYEMVLSAGANEVVEKEHALVKEMVEKEADNGL
jgi:hypothetical protein